MMTPSHQADSPPPDSGDGRNGCRVLITIATYNERENLPDLVDAIFGEAPDVDILVVDDNSPDGTGQWCDEAAQEQPKLHCLHREGKLGLGSATIAGLKYAMEHDFDWVVNMDADFSHHPRYLPDILALAKMTPTRWDVVIGSRYIPGGGIRDWPFTRRFMSWGVNVYTRWLLGLKPRDCSGAYRAYNTHLLKNIDFDTILSQGYSFQEEFLWHLKRAGARITETPILFADREKGQSKIDARESVTALWIIFRLGVRNWIGI